MVTEVFALVSTSCSSTFAFGTIDPVLSETVPVTVDVDAVCAESETAIVRTTMTSATTNPKSILTQRIKTSSIYEHWRLERIGAGIIQSSDGTPLRLGRRLAQCRAIRNLYLAPLKGHPFSGF